MARYPGARWRPIPETNTQARIAPTQVILHSAVSRASSLHGYWTSSGVDLESHFYVDQDGNVEQYVDTTVRADANYRANARAISIETWDGGNPDKTPWNSKQVAALVKLVAWCCKTHGIPARRTPGWDQPGIGGHSDYPGVWTPVRGKTCPGVARRPQVNQIIAAVAKGGTTTATTTEDDVTDDDIKKIVNGILNGPTSAPGKRSLTNLVLDIKNRTDPYLDAPISAVGAALGALKVTADVDVKAVAAEIQKGLGNATAKQVADEIYRRMKG